MNSGGEAGPVDRAQVKAASARGVAVTASAQVVRLGVQFISSIVMARLLLPADFGLVAMAAPIVAFVQLLADLGLAQATVQRPQMSNQEINFLFWICLLASLVVGAIVIALAPLSGAFYREPRVTAVVMSMGIIVMLSGFSVQHIALLNRSLRFGALAVVDLGGYLVGAIVGIGAAWSGWSYWSIVFAQAATALVSTGLAWSLARWIPSRPTKIDSARSLLAFGGNVTAFNLVNFFARNLDNILLGRFAGEAQLGLYDRAYKLLLFPLGQITAPISKIAMPVLSRSLAEADFYRSAYLRLLDINLLITFPIAVFAAMNSGTLIGFVLGAQWTGAVPIFAILSVGALFAPISTSTSWLLTTQGRTAELRNYGMVSSIAFVLSFIVGLRWGPVGVASCYIGVGVIQGPILWWAVTRKGPVSLPDLLAGLAPHIVGALIIAGFNAAVGLALTGLPRLMVCGVGSFAVFAAALLLTPRGRAMFGAILAHGKDFMASMGIPRAPRVNSADQIGDEQ